MHNTAPALKLEHPAPTASPPTPSAVPADTTSEVLHALRLPPLIHV